MKKTTKDLKNNSQRLSKISDIVVKLCDIDNADLANKLVIEQMTRHQKVSFAVFASELVIHVFEKKYTEDVRPRKAIAAAKAFLCNPTSENKTLAMKAADDAWGVACKISSGRAYDPFHDAVAAATYSAQAASCCESDDYIINAFRYATNVYNNDNVAMREIEIKLLNYGLSLLGAPMI